MTSEDLDHAGEGRDAVESALRPPDDLNPLDVLDGNLRERGVERASHRDAVQGDQERIELLQSPETDVGEAGTVVGAVGRVEAGDVLQRLGESASAPPANLFSRDDRDGVGDFDGVLGNLSSRDDDGFGSLRNGGLGCGGRGPDRGLRWQARLNCRGLTNQK